MSESSSSSLLGGGWRRLLALSLGAVLAVLAVVLVALSLLQITSWVDSSLAKDFKFSGDPQEACSTALHAYLPIAFQQSDPASSSAYLYCGWAAGNTGFRCLCCFLLLALSTALLLTILRIRSPKAAWLCCGSAALCTALLLGAAAADANALRTAADYITCASGTNPACVATPQQPCPKYSCTSSRYVATALLDVLAMICCAGIAVHLFFYLRSGLFAQQIGGDSERVDYFGEAERYFPDEHHDDDDEGRGLK